MNKRLVLSNAPEPFTTPEKPRVFRKKSSYNVDLLVAIKDNMEELKSTLHACGVKWSALYDKGVKTKPYYFGIYKTVYKTGFETAEKRYAKRLQDLVNYIETIDVSNSSTRQCIDKIKTYHEVTTKNIDKVFLLLDINPKSLRLIICLQP